MHWCTLSSTYGWCPGEQLQVWIRIESHDSEKAPFWLHICLLWKCISCILTHELVTSSLPSGHRIYKWVRTLTRISLCTQAATGKGGSTLDHRLVVLSGLAISKFLTKHPAYVQSKVITVITIIYNRDARNWECRPFLWVSQSLWKE